jgi:hypothetical protein
MQNLMGPRDFLKVRGKCWISYLPRQSKKNSSDVHPFICDTVLFRYSKSLRLILILLLLLLLLHSFIHSVFCLTTGPKPPLKRILHIVRSRASSFKWEYPLLSLRSSSSLLRLLPLLLITSISPFIFPSITCFRRQFLRKMWPIQLAFRFLISCTTTTTNNNNM